MKKLLTLTASMLFCLVLSAQTTKTDIFLEGNLRAASVFHHPEREEYLHQRYFGGGELRFGYQTHGKNKWEKSSNYPILGMTLRYTNYTDFTTKWINTAEHRRAASIDPYEYDDEGNPQYHNHDWDFTKKDRYSLQNHLGHGIAFFGYIQVSPIRVGIFTWHVQLGMGAGVFTKPYNPETNPDNVLISLYVTPYINFQTGFDFKLTKQFDLTLNGTFTHSSNASMNMPNYGINEIGAVLGLRYHFNDDFKIPSMWKKHTDSITKFQMTHSLFASIEPGFLWARYDDYYYFKTTAQVGYMFKPVEILTIGASLDATHAVRIAASRDVPNESRAPQVTQPEPPINHAPARRDITDMPRNIGTLGIYAFFEANFGRFSFHAGGGGYFWKGPGYVAGHNDLAQNSDYSENGGTLYKNPWAFEKVGFRIELGKKRKHFVGGYIRAHFPVADYFCFQYGYKFATFHNPKKK